MSQIVLGLVILVLAGWAIYAQIKCNELRSERVRIESERESRMEFANRDIENTREKLESLSRYSHIPGVLEKIERLKAEARERIENARSSAAKIVSDAEIEAERRTEEKLRTAIRALNEIDQEFDRKKVMSEKFVSEAEIEASEIRAKAAAEARAVTSEARKNAMEKNAKIEEMFSGVNVYVREVRRKADFEANSIAGKAYDALKRYEFYVQSSKALKLKVDSYLIEHMFEKSSVLDDLAIEYGYLEAGQNLKFARKRTRKLIDQEMAGESKYEDPLRKRFAIHFLLDAFDGKVESILSRVKPDRFEKLKQEIIDAFILINANGRAFEGTRITEEYRDSRIDELRWACVVQKIRAQSREDQRAIRERIRDEEKAKREFERSLKQAKREEELLERALAKARSQFETASAEDRANFLEKIGELESKLAETEGYIKRTQSLAELTKRGHVYIISNIGAFGEDVYKIGLTRRLNPEDRVNELGDASVPFRFDIHACIMADDAPALEYALHKAFIDQQLNKINKRKEFFKVGIHEIKKVLDTMGIETNWTMEAMAAEYRESLALEGEMKENADLRKRWVEDQLKTEPDAAFDEDDPNASDDFES